MNTATVSIDVRPLSSALGAEIRGVDVRDLSEETFARVLRAWHDHLVILLRGQELTEDDPWKFGLRFGPLSGGYLRELEASRAGIAYVSNVRKDGKLIGILPDGEVQFHSDQSYTEQPTQGTPSWTRSWASAWS